MLDEPVEVAGWEGEEGGGYAECEGEERARVAR